MVDLILCSLFGPTLGPVLFLPLLVHGLLGSCWGSASPGLLGCVALLLRGRLGHAESALLEQLQLLAGHL